MGNKRQQSEKSWWEKLEYGNGKLFFPKAAEVFNPHRDAFLNLSFNKLAILECLTFVAWKTNNWVVQGPAKFIWEGIGWRLQVPAIERLLRELVAEDWLEIRKANRHKGHFYERDQGHFYLVSCGLLRTSAAQELKHYADSDRLLARALATSALLRRTITDQNDRKKRVRRTITDQNDRKHRSKGSLTPENLCLPTDQNDRPDLDLDFSSEDGALHHSLETDPVGGAEGEVLSEGSPDKGVLRTGSKSPPKESKRLKALDEETAKIRAQATAGVAQ